MADNLKLKFDKSSASYVEHEQKLTTLLNSRSESETKFDVGLVTFEDLAKKKEELKMKDLKRKREYVQHAKECRPYTYNREEKQKQEKRAKQKQIMMSTLSFADDEEHPEDQHQQTAATQPVQTTGNGEEGNKNTRFQNTETETYL